MVQHETDSTAFKAQGGGVPFIIPKPPGVVIGDLLVSSVFLNTGLVSTITFPAGWTKVDEREPTIQNPQGAIGFKVADAADVIATDYTFLHTEGSDREWVGVMTRYSGALNIDNFTSGVVNDLSGQSTIAYPGHTTVADNVLIYRVAGFDFTGVEPTAVGLTALHSRVALAGGFLVTGPSNVMLVFDELNAIVTPPGFVNAANFTQTGGTGNLRAVIYTAAIAPLLFTLLTQADIETRKRVLMSKGRNLVVIVANPGSAVQSDTPGLYLVKDPEAGVGGFGKPPESAADARGDANDGWKLYSYDDVGTAYNL